MTSKAPTTISLQAEPSTPGTRRKARPTTRFISPMINSPFVEQGKATAVTKKRNQRKQVLCEAVKILGATVSCEAGHWYVSIQVEIKQQRSPLPTAVVGVDVGLKQAAVVSDG